MEPLKRVLKDCLSPSKLENSPKKSRILKTPEKKQEKSNLDKENFDFLFEDDEENGFQFEDFDKETNSNKMMKNELNNFTRCIVYKIQRDSINYDLILNLSKENDEECTTICRLQGPWCQIKVNIDDIVSVKGRWDEGSQCFVVNASEGLIVVQPDFLISGTSVVGSLFCMRKGIFQDKFRGIDSDNRIMVVGSMVHELLEIVLSRKLTSYDMIQHATKELLHSEEMMFTLYANRMTIQDADMELQKFIPNIVNFVEQHVTGKKNNQINKTSFQNAIDSIQDIEENIWLPKLGLKGKVDVTVRVRTSKKNSHTKLMPLELKTGRASFSNEHKGQLILYQMMLNELGNSVDSGLLLYLRDGILKEIPSNHNEQRDLIILRNELVYYLTQKINYDKENEDFDIFIKNFDKLQLPEPISHHSACSKCPYNIICTTFLKRDKTIQLSDQNPLNVVSKECSKHLNTLDMDFFIKWCSFLSLEDQEMKKTNPIKTIWINSPEERKRHGRAIINLKLSENVEYSNRRYLHRFELNNFKDKNEKKNDFTLIGMTPNDYVIVSTTKRISIAAGTIYDIDKTFITLNLERNLIRNYSNETFIIDKYESQSGNVFNYTNLGILLDDTEISKRLRQIIINKHQPTFSTILPKVIVTEGDKILLHLNPIQRKAVMKALTANEFMLIKGLPGTGKTQTLIAIIRLFNIMGKSVLVTSHTNSAVDNVLLRLKMYKMKFLRLGNDSRILPELIDHSETTVTASCKTPEDLAEIYSSYKIIGVTCLGSGHSIFIQRKFDICIVDEATQVFQATILRPLFYAEKFILVGDPDQLPPIVRSKLARNLGASESLFQRLDTPEATSILTLQYRMNKIITKLGNELTYKGNLNCANEMVMNGILNIPKKDVLQKLYSQEKWILRSLEKHIDQSIIILNTQNCLERNYEFSDTIKNMDPSRIIEETFSNDTNDTSPSKEQQRKFKYTNYCDAAILFSLIKALIQSGYLSENIGIIAPYRAQVELIRKLIEQFKKFYINDKEINFNNLEVNTVDQYQGRDKNVIIYSCTRTGPAQTIEEKLKENEILEDRRRLTVAITRSKHKLIIIGDEKCLEGYTPFKDLLEKIPSRCKITLDDGKLGFYWKNVFNELSKVMGI